MLCAFWFITQFYHLSSYLSDLMQTQYILFMEEGESYTGTVYKTSSWWLRVLTLVSCCFFNWLIHLGCFSQSLHSASIHSLLIDVFKRRHGPGQLEFNFKRFNLAPVMWAHCTTVWMISVWESITALCSQTDATVFKDTSGFCQWSRVSISPESDQLTDKKMSLRAGWRKLLLSVSAMTGSLWYLLAC